MYSNITAFKQLEKVMDIPALVGSANR
jgi:hypothetical protein